MENYIVEMLSSGEWKWMAVVAVGALIVAATLLVSLLRGITWPALFALIFGGLLASGPVLTPLVFYMPAPVVQKSDSERKIAALATANQQTSADLAASLKDVKTALDSLGTAIGTAGRRAALANGNAARGSGSEGDNPLLVDLNGFSKQVTAVEESLRTLAQSVEAAGGERKKLEASMEQRN